MFVQIPDPDYIAYEVLYPATLSPTSSPTLAPSSSTCPDIVMKFKTSKKTKLARPGALLKIKIAVYNKAEHSIEVHRSLVDDGAFRIYLPSEVKYLKSRARYLEGHYRENGNYVNWPLINVKHRDRRIFVLLLQVDKKSTTDLFFTAEYTSFDHPCREEFPFQVSMLIP